MTRTTHPEMPADGPQRDDDSTRTEVTVAMPAYNAAPFIRRAITSVLEQRDIALELIVVDDASTDDTAAVVASIVDPRLRLLRHERRRGIGACHNLVLRQGRSAYVAHVDADDYILPGALRRMVDALAGDPAAGQAHCHFFDVDRDGLTTRDVFAERWRTFHRDRPPTMNYRRELQRRNVANALRTFPRRVLNELGGFNERIPYAVDYELALRMAERYRIVLVPEFLYARRVHGSNTVASRRGRAPRVWWRKYRVRRRLLRDGRISFATDGGLHIGDFLRTQWRNAWRPRGVSLVAGVRRFGSVVRWRLWAPLVATLYRNITDRLPAQPLPAATPTPAAGTRVAYYLRAYPVPNETFIQREVAALSARGVSVDVIADVPVSPELFDGDARTAADATTYLGPLEERVPPALYGFLRRRPWTVARLFAYVLTRRHTSQKSLQADRTIWYHALRLGSALVAGGATHVHAPWAFGNALIALLASRLAGISFSVQARASDLYRDTSQQGLEERLGHAAFIITNARYNEATIRSRLAPTATTPVHVIYEGVDLQRLQPAAKPTTAVPLIVCVARLVEPKGLEVLLRACRLLADGGRSFRCEVIGGRDAREMNYYLSVMKLRRALALEDAVQFLGALPFDTVRAKYSEANVFALPCIASPDGRRDVTPNVIIEAMAMSLPVVSSRSGAIAELIADGVSGLLVPPGDETALAHAIARLLDDAPLRQALGTAARAAAEARFDIHRNAEQYAALFSRR